MTPGSIAARVPVAIPPVIVPVELSVVVMPPLSLLITKIVKVPTMTKASRVPIVRIGSPWSTSVPTTFTGVVTVHKLRAFLVPIRLALATSLGLSLVRSAHEYQGQPSNHEKVPESYKLHKLTSAI